MKAQDLFKMAALSGMILGGCTAPTGGEESNDPMGEPEDSSAAMGECHGINACKGKGECGGKGYSCAGKNACKGKGWIKMKKSDCDSKGGRFNG
jgi:hypothetical protein